MISTQSVAKVIAVAVSRSRIAPTETNRIALAACTIAEAKALWARVDLAAP